MEALADPYQCLIDIKQKMECGVALRVALKTHCKNHSNAYTQALLRWLLCQENGIQRKPEPILQRNSHRRSLLSVLSLGLLGESIIERLGELEKEFDVASRTEIDEKIATLPIKMLVPLLLLQFPAFLLLLFAPILIQLRAVLMN